MVEVRFNHGWDISPNTEVFCCLDTVTQGEGIPPGHEGQKVEITGVISEAAENREEPGRCEQRLS